MPTYTIAAAVLNELEIRKSRFISILVPVADLAEAVMHIQRTRVQFPDASHVCWGVLAGGQSGMSDDDEPSGTAGRPILEVLRHHEMDGVLGTVVRYYGGIKLGAGAMKLAQRVERIAMTELAIEIGYPDEARVRRWLDRHGYELIHSRHDAMVNLIVRLPADNVAHAEAALRDLTQGRIRSASAAASP